MLKRTHGRSPPPTGVCTDVGGETVVATVPHGSNSTSRSRYTMAYFRNLCELRAAIEAFSSEAMLATLPDLAGDVDRLAWDYVESAYAARCILKLDSWHCPSPLCWNWNPNSWNWNHDCHPCLREAESIMHTCMLCNKPHAHASSIMGASYTWEA